MEEQEFQQRTREVALQVIRLVDSLPKSRGADAICRQLVRSGTSIGANYRAACRAQSRAAMIAKLSIVEEESDETLYWMELLVQAEIVKESRLGELMQEVEEIPAMVVASFRTLRQTNPKSTIGNQK